LVQDSGFLVQDSGFLVQGSRFKGYNQWTLLTILIKIRNTRHTPLGETALFYAMYLPHLKITKFEKICKKLTAFLQDQKFPGSYRIFDSRTLLLESPAVGNNLTSVPRGVLFFGMG